MFLKYDWGTTRPELGGGLTGMPAAMPQLCRCGGNSIPDFCIPKQGMAWHRSVIVRRVADPQVDNGRVYDAESAKEESSHCIRGHGI